MMGYKKDPRYNNLGYSDPTAYAAIYESQRKPKNERAEIFFRAKKAISSLCQKAGFELVSLTLKDKKTGKVWRG